MERRDSFRPGKSRRNKPCDLCRQKKLLCDLSCGPPCLRCQKSAQPCVFAQKRVKRTQQKSPSCQSLVSMLDIVTDEGNRLASSSDDPALPFELVDVANVPSINSEADHTVTEPCHVFHSSSTPNVPTPEARPPGHATNKHLEQSSNVRNQESVIQSMSLTDMSNSASFMGSTPPAVTGLGTERQRVHSPVTALTDVSRSEEPKRTTLENIPGAFSFYVGPTGAFDVHLLLRQLDGIGGDPLDIATGLNFRTVDQISGKLHEQVSTPTIFGVTDQGLVETAKPRVAQSCLDDAEAEFWSLLSRKSAYHLVGLYVRFVEPCFSILSPDQLPSTADEIDNLPLALLVGICASSLPFAFHDDALYPILPSLPASERLYQISWLLYSRELHAPSLKTLQTCLVLQHNLPTNPVLSDTAFKWSHMASAVAIAQTIGLHRDPEDWSQVPEREIRLRRKLWWALWSMEKWYSLARGMPSHLHSDQSDVGSLRPEDLVIEISGKKRPHLHFQALVSLTAVLSEIQGSFYTVKAIALTSRNLELSLERARPLRVRLQQWRDQLPDELKMLRGEPMHETDSEELDANASLHLCYITTLMTLFRALLRPLESRHGTCDETQYHSALGDHPAQAVIKGSLNCAQELVNLVSVLTDTHWNAFWHSWSRSNFAIAGLFLIHLLHVMDSGNRKHHPFESDDPNGMRCSKSCCLDRTELIRLIHKWRKASRKAASGASGARSLAVLGLFKVETMLSSCAGCLTT